MSSLSFLHAHVLLHLRSGLCIRFCHRLISKTHHTNFKLPHRTAWIADIEQNDFLNITAKRHMAGHSKWQNVMHVKAEKNRQKNILCNKYAYLIRTAVREGGPDPKLNSKLASLLEQAKKNNVPSSTVESALKIGGNKKTKFGTMEVLGPGGCIIIVEYETDNISTTRHDIKVICKKYGVNVLSGEGRWRAVYEKKGIIKAIVQKSGEPVDSEKGLDHAIEAGAEDVKTRDNEETPYLEFLCAPDDLHPVKQQIEQLYEVEDCYVAYLPTVTVKLEEEINAVFGNLLEELGNLCDVVRIYENTQ